MATHKLEIGPVVCFLMSDRGGRMKCMCNTDWKIGYAAVHRMSLRCDREKRKTSSTMVTERNMGHEGTAARTGVERCTPIIQVTKHNTTTSRWIQHAWKCAFRNYSYKFVSASARPIIPLQAPHPSIHHSRPISTAALYTSR